MKILDILGESVRMERIEQHRGANALRELYKQRDKFKRAIRTYTERGDLDSAGEMRTELDKILDEIKRAEGGITEAKNHMGDREYQSYGSWKAACKKAYPGCSFRGDKDIGAAVLDGHDVGEWDGAVGSVYAAKPITEGTLPDLIARGLIDGSLDVYDVMNNPTTPAERDASRTLHQMYDVVAREHRLAPDDDFEEIQNIMYDQIADDYASNGPIAESFDNKTMMKKVKDAIKRGAAKLKEMEEDLSSMDSAAQTEKEYDAVDDFRKDVERQRRVLSRLRSSLKLRQSAKQSGVAD